MTPETISAYITDGFEHVRSASAYADVFFYFEPEPERRSDLYFATLKSTDDHFDNRSELVRLGAFRLNIDVGPDALQRMFGRPADVALADERGRFDFTVVNELLPHPLYGGAGWACILNPNRSTFVEVVAPLLHEAYERAVVRHSHLAKAPRV